MVLTVRHLVIGLDPYVFPIETIEAFILGVLFINIFKKMVAERGFEPLMCITATGL